MAVINTNYFSLVAQNNLAKSQNTLGTAIERLSSGLRINSAKDDAAGQAIANRFTSNIQGLTQAVRNANDGISLAQTAEGALNEINNNLQRIRELTVQSKNTTNSVADTASNQSEVDARLAEIDRIASQTDFNGTKVLAVSSGVDITIQVGANDAEVIGFNVSGASVGDLSMRSFSVVTGDLATITDAIAKIDRTRSGLGAIQNRFQSTIDNLHNTVSNLSAARSRIQDADYATEVSNMGRAQILQQAGTAVLAQANQMPQNMMSLLS